MPDYTALTGALSYTTIITALGAVAAVKVVPVAAIWGYDKVMSFIRKR